MARKVKSILWAALWRFALAAVVLPAFFIIPAGTLDFWQAWVYSGVVLGSAAAVGIYFLKKNPAFLLRRFEMREKEASQKKIIAWTAIPYVLVYLVPGLDKRFGWSNVPQDVSLLALAAVLLGYWMIFLTFKQNATTQTTKWTFPFWPRK